MRTRLGACVARARLHARFGSPMPTKTTSPSRSSRAATAAIISSGVYAELETVVDSVGQSLFRLKSYGQLRLFRHVACAVGDAVHELVEVVRELVGVARDALPGDVEIVVAVVVALRVGWVRPPRLYHHRAHDDTRNHGAVGIGADDLLIHQLFHDDDHALRGEGGFLLHADEAPHLGVARSVGALPVHDRDARLEGRYGGHS